MSMSLLTVVIDCDDPRRLAEFWAGVLDYELTRRNPEEFQLRDPKGIGGALYFMTVPEPKVGKNRLHLDIIATESMHDAVASLVRRGATVLEEREDPASLDNPDHWTVMLDPEGNEFCVVSSSEVTGWD